MLQAVPFSAVRIADSFWSPRLATNRTATIPHVLDMCEREGRVRNFWRAAGQFAGPFEGTRRHDADLYKAIEAAAYTLATHPDEALRRRVERMIDAIVAAQQSDGYLDTYGTVGCPPGQPRREPDLFAAGHLLDAAVGWREATGSARLLDVARRLADRINRASGPHGQPAFPSHPKIEAALDRLFQATGERRYLELALSFLNERGRTAAGGPNPRNVHNQNHLPVREQTAAEGHVICGLFLCEGMHDVGLRTADAALIAAGRRIYQDAITRRFYLTGAMGRASDERFTEPWALENRTAIGEGCQSAGLARLALRFLLLEADARHADVFERVLYNNLLANVGLDGKTFFYVNRLAARPEDATGRPYQHPLPETERERLPRFCLNRQPWFKVPCCPPNVAMTLATLGQWIYARSAVNEIYVNLYIASRVTLPLNRPDNSMRSPIAETNALRGRLQNSVAADVRRLIYDRNRSLLTSAATVSQLAPNARTSFADFGQEHQSESDKFISTGSSTVHLAMETSYPWEGRVRITVALDRPQTFTLALRIPDWCRDGKSVGGLYRPVRSGAPLPATVRVNERAVDAGPLTKGYLRIERQWRGGDEVELELPLPVLRMVADPRVTSNAGRVALQRGPLVYCVEAVDHGGRTRHLRLPPEAGLVAEHRADLLGGVTVLRGTGVVSEATSTGSRPIPLIAIPYGVWGNRQVGEMEVWLR